MKQITLYAAFLGLTSVIMGAASDHLFAGLLTAESAQRFDVALRYHQLYAILVFSMGLYGLRTAEPPSFKIAGYLFCIGCTIFCGSLYASLFPGLDKATILTPIGGLTIMAAWVSCMISVLLSIKRKS